MTNTSTPSSNWLQQFTGATQPSAGVSSVSARRNPFQGMGGQNASNQSTEDEVGVNRPYASPRFLGYFRNQSIYAGGRLNVSC
jgi:hypothetical protein